MPIKRQNASEAQPTRVAGIFEGASDGELDELLARQAAPGKARLRP